MCRPPPIRSGKLRPRVGELSRYGSGGSLACLAGAVGRCHTMTLQPTPPASARSRLLCRRESVARLAKSGSFVALRPACAPWLRVRQMDLARVLV
jgi:hypothetical protein